MSDSEPPDRSSSQLPLEPSQPDPPDSSEGVPAAEPIGPDRPHDLVEPPEADAELATPRAAVPRGSGAEAADEPDAAPPPQQEQEPVAAIAEPPAAAALSHALPHPRPLVPDAAVVLTALVTLAFLMFLLTEPTQRWIALLGVVVAALGTDGLLRSARSEAFALGLDTTPQLFLPALYALALPVFIEHNARGLWVPLSGVAAGLGFGAVVLAEVHSVRAYEAAFAWARMVSGAAAYLTAFAVLSLSYTFDLELAPAIAAAALVAGLLSIEVLRDASLDTLDTLTFAAVAALVIGELRWALHFVPLDGHLAALALVLALFFTSGVLYSHLHRQLTRAVLVEYVVVAAAGVILVVAARATDLA